MVKFRQSFGNQVVMKVAIAAVSIITQTSLCLAETQNHSPLTNGFPTSIRPWPPSRFPVSSTLAPSDKAAAPSEIEQVPNVSELRDVSPGDWAYEALRSLIERYGCISGYAARTFQGHRALSRYEFASGLKACLAQMQRSLDKNTEGVQEDLIKLQRIAKDFQQELTQLDAKVSNLENRTAFLEDHQFSTTTKLIGNLIVQTNAYFSGEGQRGKPQVATQYNLFVGQITSFTGKDTLLAGLASTNTTLADVAPYNDGRWVGPTREGTTYAASAGDLNNVLRYITLQYQFPITDQLIATIVPVNRYNFATTLLPKFIPDYLFGVGPVSSFAAAPPIYLIGGGTGASLSYDFSDSAVLSLTYMTPTGFLPNEGQGVFQGDYVAAAQMNYNPTPNLFLQLLYQKGYFGPGNFAFNNGQTFNPGSGFVGTGLANRFDDAGVLFTDASSVSTNAYGFGGYYAVNPHFSLGGWVNFIQARLFGKGDADIWTYSLQAVFPDLGQEGNLGGLVVGMEPALTGLQTSLPYSSSRNDTSLHLEAFYRHRINDHLTVTPYVTSVRVKQQGIKPIQDKALVF